MKTGIAPVVSEVSLELIAASGGVGVKVMDEICLKVLDGFGMPIEWALSIVVAIFKGNDDIRNCSCYSAVKLLEYGMNVVVRVLEKRLCGILYVDEMQHGFMPKRGTINAEFIL